MNSQNDGKCSIFECIKINFVTKYSESNPIIGNEFIQIHEYLNESII